MLGRWSRQVRTLTLHGFETDPMLIPRFSIRWVLAFTAVCAVFSFVVAQGIGGEHWAMAITAATALLVSCFLLFAATFVLAYGLARVTSSLQAKEGPKTPFASNDQLPRQVVPKNPYSDQS